MLEKLKVFVRREVDGVSLRVTTEGGHLIDSDRLEDAFLIFGAKKVKKIQDGLLVEMPFRMATDYVVELLAVSGELSVSTGA